MRAFENDYRIAIVEALNTRNMTVSLIVRVLDVGGSRSFHRTFPMLNIAALIVSN